jgi:hypothetical protein
VLFRSLLYLLAPKQQLLGQPYLAGANLADTDAAGGRSFQGSLGAQNVNTANYYLADFFPEARMHRASVLLTGFVIFAMFLSAYHLVKPCC